MSGQLAPVQLTHFAENLAGALRLINELEAIRYQARGRLTEGRCRIAGGMDGTQELTANFPGGAS